MLVVLLIAGYLVLSTQAQFQWDTCPDNSGIITNCMVTSDNCFSDYNCSWGRKCCPGGCGRTCQIPVRCRVSPFGSKRFCIHSGMCIRSRDEYCCNFRCQEPFGNLG